VIYITEVQKTQEELQIKKQKEIFERWFVKLKGINLIDLSIDKNSVVGAFKKEDLRRYLKDISNETNQKNLRKISRHLYRSSSHYRTLINYYSTLYNFDYVIEGFGLSPEDIKDRSKYKKSYFKSVDFIERMNIKHESIKIRFNTYLDGVFYGFVRSAKDSFYIQQLDPDYCRITFINYETGQYGYSFNFNLFVSKPQLLDSYPEEFREIFNSIKNSKSGKDYWKRIDSPNAICIKAVPDMFPIPPLVGVFEGILDIADFKALSKGKEEIGNYLLLSHQIPMKDSKEAEVNDFLISEDFVRLFHDNVAANLPEQVGLVTTPMKIEAIKFERDTADKNKVAEATSQFWNEAGVSELLFGNNNSSAALKYSIQADEASLSPLIEDIQRWVNEYLKVNLKGANKFRVRILYTTKFNVKDYFDTRLKAAQFGFPVRNEIMAIMGLSPSAIYANTFLENEILELDNKLIPLKSSHVGDASNNNAGRPKANDEDLTDSGAAVRESVGE
jgi:hypothetical protein